MEPGAKTSDFAESNERSLAYARVRQSLQVLSRLPVSASNWRPHLVVLSQGGKEPPAVLEYARLLGARHGVVSRVVFRQGLLDAAAMARSAAARRRAVVGDVFEEEIVAPDVEAALPVFLQAHALGPLKPNLALLSYPVLGAGPAALVARLRALAALQISSVVMLGVAPLQQVQRVEGHIDIWWRGYANGSLMLILAHLLTLNPGWQGVRIRILRLAKNASEQQAASDELRHLISVSRIPAETRILVSTSPFSAIMREESRDAAALLLGFVLPSADPAVGSLFESTARALDGMPPAFLVSTSGAADLLG